MPNGKYRIAMIGAGETGTPLLERLLAADFVRVVGVADLDDQAPGMVLARAQGVKTFNDFMHIARMGEDVDIIIDVTGVHKVRDGLRQAMQDTDNHHTIIMHEAIAGLMMSLFKGEMVRTKHQDLDY